MTHRPNFVLALVLALAACGGSAATKPANTTTAPTQAAAPDLSTADGVIEASIAAQGGRDKMAKIKSLKLTGTLVIPQMGFKGNLISLTAPPRNSLTTIEISGLGKLAQGVKDDVVWELNPMQGARIVKDNERVMQLREATFNADLVWKELYPKAEHGGVVDFNGTQAYKITMTAKEGDTQIRYIAKDTLLPIGMQMTAETQMGKVPVEMAISDYREVNGIKYPHKIVRKEGPQQIEIAVATIEQDVAVAPNAFDLPPEIAALIKK
jgi:hypothetical protein